MSRITGKSGEKAGADPTIGADEASGKAADSTEAGQAGRKTPGAAGARQARGKTADAGGARHARGKTADAAGARQARGKTADAAGARQARGKTADAAGARRARGKTADAAGARQTRGKTANAAGAGQAMGKTADAAGARQAKGNTADAAGARQASGKPADAAGARQARGKSADTAGAGQARGKTANAAGAGQAGNQAARSVEGGEEDWSEKARRALLRVSHLLLSPWQGDEAWREEARRVGLTDKGVWDLERQRFTVSPQVFRQVFVPYVEQRMPVFITADSVLSAFHVLFEQTLANVEQGNARRLGRILSLLHERLPAASQRFRCGDELVAAARRRATILVATALRLCGGATHAPAASVHGPHPAEGLGAAARRLATALVSAALHGRGGAAHPVELDAATSKLVDEEVALAEEAAACFKPAWLGEPDEDFRAIDYSHFRPRGFYNRSPLLQRYFRAVAFLQAVPMRVDDDEELLAFLMLVECLCQKGGGLEQEEEVKDFFLAFRSVLGTREAWDLEAVSRFRTKWPRSCDKAGLRSVRQVLNARAEATSGGSGGRAAARPRRRLRLYLLSPLELPESSLMQEASRHGRRMPSGDLVLAALGSTRAMDRIRPGEESDLLAEIERWRENKLETTSIYGRYMHCLASLFLPMDPGAPDFTHSAPWQARLEGTVHGGWAQMRHAFVLMAKPSWVCLGMRDSRPAGFVEPAPEFFGRLALLVEKLISLLVDARALAPTNRDMGFSLEDLAMAVEEEASHPPATTRDPFSAPPSPRSMAMDWLNLEREWSSLRDMPASEMVSALRALAARLHAGHTPPEPAYGRFLKDQKIDLSVEWALLWRVLRWLESLSRRQLRGLEPEEDDVKQLRAYGKTLATCMMYRGDSHLNPDDDAPRVADVFTVHDPLGGPRGSSRHLEVAVGRPRAMYVIYPWKGRVIGQHGSARSHTGQAVPLTAVSESP